MKNGTAALADAVSSANKKDYNVAGAVYGKSKAGEQDFVCRVEFVLCDDSDKIKYQKYLGIIGTVECRPVIDDNLSSDQVLTVFPIDSNIKKLPLVNELILVRATSNFNTQDPDNNYHASHYYTDIIGTWFSPEHNATPDAGFFKDKSKSVTGDRFKETGLIRPLIHNPGDITFEGRFGNTIRLGGSNKTSIKNPLTGEDNNPVILIKNGQNINLKKELNTAIYEDINNDGSSFYMLTGQNNPLVLGNYNFESYGQKVESTKRNMVEIDNVVNNTPSTSLKQNETAPVKDEKYVEKKVITSGTENKDKNKLSDELASIPNTEREMDEFATMTSDLDDLIDLNQSVSEVYEDANSPTITTGINFALNVKHVIQNTSWKCFLASTEMVMKYYGITSEATQNTISDVYLDSSNKFKSNDFYKSKGFNITKVNILGGVTGYSKIIQVFKEQTPRIPIILYRKPSNLSITDSNRGHFVVVVGVTDSNRIIVNDPGRKDGYRVILREEQLRDSGGNLRIPKKYR
jgi:hypothetical protein